MSNLRLNLIYFDGKYTSFVGFNSLRGEGYIRAGISDSILYLKRVKQKGDETRYKYFVGLTHDKFIYFLKAYCGAKKISGLQFTEIDGVYYEMYGGDDEQIKRAIHYYKEHLRMERITGQINTVIDLTSIEKHDED